MHSTVGREKLQHLLHCESGSEGDPITSSAASRFVHTAGKKKAKRRQSDTAEKEQPAAAEVDLQIKLAAAEAEAERLRQLVDSGAKKKPKLETQLPDIGEEPEGDAPGKALNHKERKRLQRAAYKAAKRDLLKNEKAALRKQRRREQQSEQKAQADASSAKEAILSKVMGGSRAPDMSAWKPYELDAEVEKALSEMGFTIPTPIQQECLPSAIRDRRDVIGAAQTVGSPYY